MFLGYLYLQLPLFVLLNWKQKMENWHKTIPHRRFYPKVVHDLPVFVVISAYAFCSPVAQFS